MMHEQDLKANQEQAFENAPISPGRQKILTEQKDQLVACIRTFFDESGACGPVCFLNDAMKYCEQPAEGLRISSFLMRLERFDSSIGFLMK